jgi:hypothetical protein
MSSHVKTSSSLRTRSCGCSDCWALHRSLWSGAAPVWTFSPYPTLSLSVASCVPHALCSSSTKSWREPMVRLLKSKAPTRLSLGVALRSLLWGVAVAMLCWSVVDHLLPNSIAAPAPATAHPSVVHLHNATSVAAHRPVPVRTPSPPPLGALARVGICAERSGLALRHRWWTRPHRTRPRPRATASRTTSRCAL